MDISSNTVEYINNIKNEYEDRYKIKVCMWFVRKSSIRGLGRKNSDLDVVFIYLSEKENIDIIFERSDFRNEIQCFNFKDIVKLIIDNKIKAQAERYDKCFFSDSSIHSHYILNYYDGFFCYYGNSTTHYFYEFDKECKEYSYELFEPKIVAHKFQEEIDCFLRETRMGYFKSLNSILSVLWEGLASCHILDGGYPGDVNILVLAKQYVAGDDYDYLCDVVDYFRNTNQKQSNYMIQGRLLDVLEGVQTLVVNKLKNSTSRYVNVEEIGDALKRYMCRML